MTDHRPPSHTRQILCQLTYASRLLSGLAVCIAANLNLPSYAQNIATTTGYHPHERNEAPGTLLWSSDSPLDAGRVTNVLYHGGWLMAGYEVPGSGPQNDMRFRVLDISNLENNTNLDFLWPSDFGLSYANDQWYEGNWGVTVHGHSRTALSINGGGVSRDRAIHVKSFGGPVERGFHPDDRIANSNLVDVNGLDTVGRLMRNDPWFSTHDWFYTEDDEAWIALGLAWRNDLNEGFTVENHTKKVIARVQGGRSGVRGFGDMLGDKFFVLSDHRESGIAIYDIPDDRLAFYRANPLRGGNLTDGRVGLNAIPIMSQVGVVDTFGGYWPEFYAHSDGQLYAVASVDREGTDARILHVARLTDPNSPTLDFSNPVMVRSFNTRDVNVSLSGVSYPKFQDNLLFIGGFIFNMDRLIGGDPDPLEQILELPRGRNMTQYNMPLGNLVVSGGNGESSGGMFLHVRQQQPDTQRPRVAFHVPEDGRTNYSVHMPISVIIHEELDYRTLQNGINFSLEKVVNGQRDFVAVDCIAGFTSGNVLTLTPVNALEEDTTYQVTFPAGVNGIKDISGNTIFRHTFRFSTGNSLSNQNEEPTIRSFTSNSLKYPLSDQQSSVTASFSLRAEDTAGDVMEYRFDPGDDPDSGFGDWLPLGSGDRTVNFSHNYNALGLYTAEVQVRDSQGSQLGQTLTIRVHRPLPSGPRPTESSPIIESAGLIWAVNPDANTVTSYDPDTGDTNEYSVGIDPRSIAADVNGRLWVTCFDSDEVYILNTNGSIFRILTLSYGDQPYAVCASPNGRTMYVSSYGAGGLYTFPNVNNPVNANFIPLGTTARAIAVNSDNSKVYVTRFISDGPNGTVWRVNTADNSVQEIGMSYITDLDTPSGGAGIPNYLAGIAISPYGDYAVVSGIKSNVLRGIAYGTEPTTHENSVRPMVAVIDVIQDEAVYDPFGDKAFFDLDNSDSPTGIRFSPDGLVVFIAVQGNNQIQGLDVSSLGQPVDSAGAADMAPSTSDDDAGIEGLAPQGLVVYDGHLYSQNFMSRSITVFEATDVLERNLFRMDRLEIVNKVSVEGLDEIVRRGKEIFYNAIDERMGSESYISCASCHIDGGHDGQVWDFTHTGEGLRRTTDLRGRSGTGHGRVHWSGNFDEIQDFETVMRARFLGTGFTDDADFVDDPAHVFAGLNPDLDALAAYVESLAEESVPRSPYRSIEGHMAAEAIAGIEHFKALNCMTCHAPVDEYTNSAFADLQDVGSLSTLSGDRLGATLRGIDTPSLLGLHASNTYSHIGITDSLEEFFEYTGGTLYHAATSSNVSVANTNAPDYFLFSKGALSGGEVTAQGDPVGLFEGQVVRLNNGNSLTFTINNPGVAGAGRLMVRAWIGFGDPGFDILVNGERIGDDTMGSESLGLAEVGGSTARPFYGPRRWKSFEVDFLGRRDNTIEFRHTGGNLLVEAIMVTLPNEMTPQLNPHRRVIDELTASERNELYQLLLQIDGRNYQGDFGPWIAVTGDSIVSFPVNTIDAIGDTELSAIPSSATITWSGPQGVQFADIHALSTEVVFPAPGDYTLTLTVDDGFIQSTDTFDVSVDSGLPLNTFQQSRFYQSDDGSIVFEAENGRGPNTSAWSQVALSGASGGFVIQNLDNSQGGLDEPADDVSNFAIFRYPFTTNSDSPSEFNLHYRLHSATTASNSFFWRINDGQAWNLADEGGVGSVWRTLGPITITPGTQNGLQIVYREQNTPIDKFVLLPSDQARPTGNGPDESVFSGVVNYARIQSNANEMLNPDASPESDLNQDGIANIIDYLMGGALEADANAAKYGIVMDGSQKLRFQRRVNAGDYALTSWMSDDLVSWELTPIREDNIRRVRLINESVEELELDLSEFGSRKFYRFTAEPLP